MSSPISIDASTDKLSGTSQRAWRFETHDIPFSTKRIDTTKPMIAIDLRFFARQVFIDGEAKPICLDWTNRDDSLSWYQYGTRDLPSGSVREVGIRPDTKNAVLFFTGALNIEQQLFFARRIRVDAFKSFQQFAETVKFLTPSFDALKVLLERSDEHVMTSLLGNFFRDQLESTSPVRLKESQKLKLSSDQSIENLVSNLIYNDMKPKDIVSLLKQFVSADSLKPEEIAKGLERSLSLWDEDRSFSEVYGNIKTIRKLVGELCDVRIGQVLAHEAGMASERVYFGTSDESALIAKINKVEDFVNSLSEEGKEAFTTSLNSEIDRQIRIKDHGRDQGPSHFALILAIRAAGGNVDFGSVEKRDLVLQYLSPKEVALAFYNEDDTSFVANALVDRCSTGSGDWATSTSNRRIEDNSFLFGKTDWMTGSGDGNSKLRTKIAREFSLALIDRINLDIDFSEQRNPGPHYAGKITQELQAQWEALGLGYGKGSGLTKFVKSFGDSIGRNWKAHKVLVDHLMKNGKTFDRVELAKANCLGRRLGNVLLEANGVEQYGRKLYASMNVVAKALAEEQQVGGDIEGPLSTSFYAMRRTANGEAARNAELKVASVEITPEAPIVKTPVVVAISD